MHTIAITMPISEAAEKLRTACNNERLMFMTRLFAELIAKKLAARTDDKPFSAVIFMIECQEGIARLDALQSDLLVRKEGSWEAENVPVLLEYWAIPNGAKGRVAREIYDLARLTFGEEFEAEFRPLWPSE
jgi:hypothetical protein